MSKNTKQLLNDLTGENEESVIRAAQALGDLKDVKAVKKLGKIFSAYKDNEEVCLAAAQALAKIGGNKAIRILCKKVAAHGNQIMQVAAAKALSTVQDPIVINALADVIIYSSKGTEYYASVQENLGREEPKEVRLAVVQALRGRKETQAVDALLAAVCDKDADVRLVVVKALGDLQDARAVKVLKELEQEATKQPEATKQSEATKQTKQPKSEFKIINGEIVEYIGDAVNVDIPEVVDGQKVIKIGIRAFSDKKLESITIPSNIDEIKGRAFENNTLKHIELPKNLEIIETCAFSENQLTQIEFPETLTKINHGAFKKNKLKEVYIPDSVAYIGEYAFNANQIESASIPSKRILDTGSFDESVTIIERNKENTKAQENNGDNDFELEDFLEAVTVRKYLGDSKHVVIPSEHNGKTVDSISDGAFEDKGIESVVIPDTIKVIGEDAFSNNKLIEVIIPDSVEIIYSRAFRNNRLSHLAMSKNLTQLGTGAFLENNFVRVRVPYSIIQRNEFMRYMLSTGFDAGVKIDIMP